MKKSKAYCTCPKPDYVAASLQAAGRRKDGGIQFVCARCYKPFWEVWDSIKDTCENCLGVFSSPYELICKRCAEREPYLLDNGPPYRSWAWARGVQKAYLEALQAKDWPTAQALFQ